jgi:RNA polymerase sigma factor (sigma-70 family)
MFLPRIRKLITLNGGSEADAQDIFQSAILTIYEKAQAKDFQLTSKFYTLLYGICRNLWGNRLQKKSFKEVTLLDDVKYSSEENIEVDIEKTEEQELFWDAFQHLGEDCQKLLRLFFDKEKMEKIAKMMGYGSVSYAKKRKFQCKEKLIEWIKKDDRFNELRNGQ